MFACMIFKEQSVKKVCLQTLWLTDFQRASYYALCIQHLRVWIIRMAVNYKDLAKAFL